MQTQKRTYEEFTEQQFRAMTHVPMVLFRTEDAAKLVKRWNRELPQRWRFELCSIVKVRQKT